MHSLKAGDVRDEIVQRLRQTITRLASKYDELRLSYQVPSPLDME
jgi:hypothetical protein